VSGDAPEIHDAKCAGTLRDRQGGLEWAHSHWQGYSKLPKSARAPICSFRPPPTQEIVSEIWRTLELEKLSYEDDVT
jgi:hypothetical protein